MRRTDRAASALHGRSAAVDARLDRCRHGGVVVPDYEGYCFANVPRTVGDVLDVDVGRSLPEDTLVGVETDVSHVVVVILDGLGWDRFHRDRDDHRFLSRLGERAAVTPLTSVLPSSTASAVTTAHTGATPAEHGVFGWDVRLPDNDVTVEAFLHEYHDALASVTAQLSQALYDDLDGETAAETLLMVTADHGLVDLEPGPAGCIDVLSVEGVADALARGPSGEPVHPWGDHRLLHLAVQRGEQNRVRAALESRGVTVFTREEVRELGLYGPATTSALDRRCGSAFDQRCGDLVCTHPDRKLVSPSNRKAVPKIGMHGGPTARETLVPFAAARLSELR